MFYAAAYACRLLTCSASRKATSAKHGAFSHSIAGASSRRLLEAFASASALARDRPVSSGDRSSCQLGDVEQTHLCSLRPPFGHDKPVGEYSLTVSHTGAFCSQVYGSPMRYVSRTTWSPQDNFCAFIGLKLDHLVTTTTHIPHPQGWRFQDLSHSLKGVLGFQGGNPRWREHEGCPPVVPARRPCRTL